MNGIWEKLLNGDFMPHGHCLLWRNDLLLMHVVSDAFIGLSYFAIPAALIFLIRRRDDLRFNWIFVMFSIFIVACGASHFIEILNIWHGYYYFEGTIKVATALASLATAIAVWPLIPKILALPSNAILHAKTKELERTQRELAQLNEELERRVKERTAQLASASQEMESFSYSVSHDLRAPLRALAGYSALLKEEHANQLDANGRRVLDKIIVNSKRMGQLIDDILAFSRLSKVELQTNEVDMRSLFQEVYEELVNEQANGRDIDFQIEDIESVVGDKAMLRQAVANLVSNALKYTRHESRAVIRVSGYLESDHYVFHVSDNGVGFYSGYAEKLFGVFQRLHSRKEFEGSGVGLAIVQRVIQRHGGRVWGEGELDRGAKFYFSLPLRRGQWRISGG